MTDLHDRRVRTSVLLAVVFGGLTLLFTYPIWTAPDTYLNALGDVRMVAWALAWDAHALITDPLGIFDANIFFPSRGTLAFSESFLGVALSVAPINWAGHPVLAYNVAMLTAFMLSGVGAALWVRHLYGNLAAGVIAGVVWAFAPGKIDQFAHLHLLVGQWIPFALWTCTRWVESGRRRDLIATAAFAALQFVFSLHYGVYLVPFLMLYGLALLRLMPNPEIFRQPRRLARDVAVAALLFVIVCLPVAAPHLILSQQLELTRSYDELLSYSAEPASFLSGSRYNRTPHVAWLTARFRTVDANYFPGLTILALAAFAYAVMLPRALVARRRRAGGQGAGDRLRARDYLRVAARVRGRLCGAVGLVAAACLLLHIAGLLAVWQGGSGVTAAWVLDLNARLSPALWLAVAATAVLFTLPATAAPSPGMRRGVFTLVIGYLALLAYLLAFGPEVFAAGIDLGTGPYWLLYESYPPIEGIRAVGRIGLLWILFVGALAGLAFADLSERLPGLRWRHTAACILLLAVVWEYRAWPIRAQIADAQDSIDVWLAEQPGDFAVVHAPMLPRPRVGGATRYMLGSVLHWKPLVNGFSGYFPPAHEALADAEPLSEEFFKLLRSDFPVRYLLVHADLLDDDAAPALRRVLSRRTEAELVERVDDTYVFEVPRDAGSGAYVRRRYVADELADARGVEFIVRGPDVVADPETVVFAGWGNDVQLLDVTDSWQGRRVAMPAGFVAALDGHAGSFEARVHRLIPLGGSGARIVSDFQFDIHGEGVGIGVAQRWLHRSAGPGFKVYALDGFGTRISGIGEFPATAAGAAAMRTHVETLPSGTTVAVALFFDEAQVLDRAVSDALRLVGVDAATLPETVSRVVVLGRTGAPPGSALLHGHDRWAIIEFDGEVPELEMMGIRLY